MIGKSSQKTLREYGRGIIGGLIFSLPLIYTMEMWWTGFSASPGYLLTALILTYLLLIGYNTYAGMKKEYDLWDICWESFEEIGLAFVVSFIFLLLISQISLGMSFHEIAGKVIVESMIVAIGISVGTAQLGDKSGKDSGMEGNREEKRKKNNEFIQMLVLSLCGAVLFASSVAPTEEILQIAVESEIVHLLIMVFLSIVISFVTLFFSNFIGSGAGKMAREEMFLHVIIGYLVALFVAFGFLLFFGRITGHGFQIILAQIIVLAIPGTLGASAGRLLIGA